MSVYHLILFPEILNLSFELLYLASRLFKSADFLTSLLNLSCENKPQWLLILAHFVYFAASNVRTVELSTPTHAHTSLSDSGKVRGRLTEIAAEFPANMIDFMIALSPQLVFMLSRHAKSFQHDKWHKKRGTARWKAAGSGFHFKAHLLPDTCPPPLPPMALLMAWNYGPARATTTV